MNEPARPAAWNELCLPALSLWRREMVRFARQRSRVISSMLTPVIFWVLLGVGLNRAFSLPDDAARAGLGESRAVDPAADSSAVFSGGGGVSYTAYLFPGTVVFILLSTAVFSTISIIEDRQEGFLQAVLAAPVRRLAVVLGKVLGGASIATLQGAVFLMLWPWVGGGGESWLRAAGPLPAALGVMFLLAVGLTAVGLCLAWWMDSTAGFHAVMMILLMPMWFLSGAVFPAVGAPVWLRALMYANPLTYGQAALAGTLAGDGARLGTAVSTIPALALTAALAAAAVLIATLLVQHTRKDGAT